MFEANCNHLQRTSHRLMSCIFAAAAPTSNPHYWRYSSPLVYKLIRSTLLDHLYRVPLSSYMLALYYSCPSLLVVPQHNQQNREAKLKAVEENASFSPGCYAPTG